MCTLFCPTKKSIHEYLNLLCVLIFVKNAGHHLSFFSIIYHTITISQLEFDHVHELQGVNVWGWVMGG